MNEEQNMQMANLLLDAIDTGMLNENTIGMFNCWYLNALFEVTRCMSDGKNLYLHIKNYLENINIHRLKKKEKIIVGFIANDSSSWIGDELFELFKQSNRFVPYVYLISNHNVQKDEMISEYKENLEYFQQKKNLQVVQTLDLDTGRQYTWEEVGVKPDLCIWLTSWTELFREQYHLLNYPLDVLHMYVPYGFMLAQDKTGRYVFDQYNKLIHNVAWKIFEDSQCAVEMAEKYTFVGSSNAVYTGSPKMDGLYQTHADIIWDALRRKAGNPTAKKIIYAPHHTVSEDDIIVFSTFADNYQIMLSLAKKYGNDTVWVFKPHPHLKYKAIQAGIFKDMNEWKEYENQWRNLQNADVIDEGMYDELFVNSDAMILDSVSFLAEYLYVHKPLLQLMRKEQRYNDVGDRLIKVHYVADGKDEEAIERFLQEVVLGGKDNKRELREEFFVKNFDYRNIYEKSAAENIFEQIKKCF